MKKVREHMPLHLYHNQVPSPSKMLVLAIHLSVTQTHSSLTHSHSFLIFVYIDVWTENHCV